MGTPPHIITYIKQCKPLKFTALSADSSVKIASKLSSGIQLETSVDDKATWNDYVYNKELSSNPTIVLQNVGDSVYFRAKSSNDTFRNSFKMTGCISASGNIQTLLKNDGTRRDVPDYCFQYAFRDCSALVSPPELPATKVGQYSYSFMFQNCYNLQYAPELPAKDIDLYCYSNMFNKCHALVAGPKLPATSFNEQRPANLVIPWYGEYGAMFSGCSSLTSAPDIECQTLYQGSCGAMFNQCISLKNICIKSETLCAECFASFIGTYFANNATIDMRHVMHIGSNALSSNANVSSCTIVIGPRLQTLLSGNAMYNTVFEFTNDDIPGFEISNITIEKGSSKTTKTANISTDNLLIKNQVASQANQYTIVNTYHLNGEPWE